MQLCKGFCTEYEEYHAGAFDHYATGGKFCRRCDVYFRPDKIKDEVKCPCCHLILRSHTRGSYQRRHKPEEQVRY